jgi:hypothetical protein
VSEPQSPTDTTTTARREPSLSPEQLTEVLGLIKGADSVELKVSVPDSNRRSTVTALQMDPLAAQIRQVTFFDTIDLALNRAGVVVRARRVQGREGDTVVKLRPVVPDALAPEWRSSPLFGVEVDAMPGGFVCSASLKAKREDVEVKAVFDGETSIRKILTKEQRAFYAEHAPEGLELDSLLPLGPINVLKLKFAPEGFDRKLVAELWQLPDGSRMLELSTKCAPNEAFEVAAETKAYLGAHGIDLGADQQTKTRTALQFFASEQSAVGEAPDRDPHPDTVVLT